MCWVVPAIDEAREACCVQNQIRGNVELRRGRRFACGWKLVVARTGIRGDEQKSEQESRSPEAIRKEVKEDADNNESHQHDHHQKRELDTSHESQHGGYESDILRGAPVGR